MAKIIFILGGARSGKSSYALKLAKKSRKKVVFIATCQSLDKEMAKRIKSHKESRPKNWQTFEEPYKVAGLLNELRGRAGIILLDCLTLLVSNLMLKGWKNKNIENEINDILKALSKAKGEAIIVSNEVGLGIVPDNKLGRHFRDVAGKMNQVVAKSADKVFFMLSGIPMKLK